MALRRLPLALIIAAKLAAGAPYEEAPILYSRTVSADPLAALVERMRGRESEFRALGERERVLWLLKALDVPVESQLLVFSRTSLQRRRIGPRTPRALYFSDEAYVGWVPGGLLEVTVFDPRLGAVFYSIDPAAGPGQPLAVRGNDCLLCHDQHEETPTLRARSVYPDATGEPLGGSSAANIDPSTPLAQRWGGWFVTGAPAGLAHRGNRVGAELADFDTASGGTALDPVVPAGGAYPRRTSDVVALLVHDHQVHVHNVLVAAAQRARVALHRWPVMREVLRLPPDAPLSGSCLLILESEADKVVRALLGAEDAPWPDVALEAEEGFAAAYARGRRADRLGRSLRDLDLRVGLFAHRCSPLIHGATFRNLPPELRTRVLARLDAGLRSPKAGSDFAHLSDLQRRTLHSILTETMEGLPPGWGR